MARAMAGELGWDDARQARERDDWAELVRLEGLVPRGSRPAAAGERREEAPLQAGAAPEEAA